MASVRIRGERGSWYADVEGERLPCVHDKNMKPGGWYRAPADADPSHLALLEAIRSCGRVVVRKSERISDDAAWESKGYIGVFDVADAIIEDGEFQFRFLRRTHDVRK